MDCGGPADVGDNPGWGWAETAGQVYPPNGPNGPAGGTGSSVDTCSQAIQRSLGDINTICCKDPGACPAQESGAGGVGQAGLGLGRIVALHSCSSTSHQIRQHIRCLCF